MAVHVRRSGLLFRVLASAILLEGAAAGAVRFAAVSATATDRTDRLLALAAQAADRGAAFVVLPEWSMTAPEPLAGETVDCFAKLAKERKIWIALPVSEAAETPGRHFETTVLLNPRGQIAARHRKILTHHESADRGSVYDLAESIPVAIPGGSVRIGIMAGDDIQAGVPRLAARGAAAVLVTSDWDGTEQQSWTRICSELSRKYRVNVIVASRNPSVSGVYSLNVNAASPAAGSVVLAGIEPPSVQPGPLGLPPIPAPTWYDNEPVLRELGRQLFFDAGLSSTGKVSCATCHRPDAAFAAPGGQTAGVGGVPGRHDVPSLLNVAYRGALFWDGMSSGLESQAKFPMTHAHEMNRHYLDSVSYVREQARYSEAFRAIGRERAEYGDIAAALASYERSLVSGDSPFDRYLYGGDATALGESAIRGLDLFRGKAGCASCHTMGPEYALLMDQQFHNTGVAYDAHRAQFLDTGFGALSYQGKPGLFLTPSLRNVAKTAPYMHDGSLRTLRDVVAFYDAGGRPNPFLDPSIRPLHLSAREQSDLISFLESLSGSDAYSPDGRKLPAAATVATIDFKPRAGDVAGNRRRIETLVSRAAAQGAKLVVLPEHAGGWQLFYSELARRHHVWLAASAPQSLAQSHRVYMRTILFDEQGKLRAAVRKATPEREEAGISAGDFRTLEPVETPLGRIGILSGSDVIRGIPRLGWLGARLIAVVASWTAEDAKEWAPIVQQLERESGATVVTATLRNDRIAQVAWTIEPPAPSPALGLPPAPRPASLRAEKASVEFGGKLFFDPALSRDGRVSCATCHDPALLFTKPERFVSGVYGRVSKVHVPGLVNNAYRLFQTWEGRVESAPGQIRNALLGFLEMDMTEEEVERAVAANPAYRDDVRAVTGESTAQFDQITSALASFIRTITSGNSPFDRFQFGGDRTALNEREQRGLALFKGKAGCASCHSISAEYALFADNRFHNTGIGYRPYFRYLGYAGDGLEGNPVTKNKFRGEYLTPSLRNVARTAPYMHDGSIPSLREVVRFYNRGGKPNPFLDSRIRPLHLTPAEQEDLARFLESLNGDVPSISDPKGVNHYAALGH